MRPDRFYVSRPQSADPVGWGEPASPNDQTLAAGAMLGFLRHPNLQAALSRSLGQGSAVRQSAAPGGRWPAGARGRGRRARRGSGAGGRIPARRAGSPVPRKGVSSRIVAFCRIGARHADMTRPLRIEFAGALCHAASRGDRREAIWEEGIGGPPRKRLRVQVQSSLLRRNVEKMEGCRRRSQRYLPGGTRDRSRTGLAGQIRAVTNALQPDIAGSRGRA